MRGVPGAQFFACWINPSPKNAENGLDKPMLNLHLNKYPRNKEGVLWWATCWVTSLTSANEPWRQLTAALLSSTCNVFVSFGFWGRASVTESVRKYSCCLPWRASRWGTQTSACVPTDVTRLDHRGVRILGDGVINHGVRQKHPAFSDSHADKRGATPWLAVLIALLRLMMRWSARDPFSGTCEDAGGAYSPHVSAVSGTLNPRILHI